MYFSTQEGCLLEERNLSNGHKYPKWSYMTRTKDDMFWEILHVELSKETFSIRWFIKFIFGN